VRTFRFSSSAGRMASINDMKFDGSQTKLGPALEGAREELAGLPVAALVLVTDGADTTDTAIGDVPPPVTRATFALSLTRSLPFSAGLRSARSSVGSPSR
jgi:hypothetical protein